VKRTLPKITAHAGFTLIEVVITMTLFIVVLMIASDAFNKIVTQASKLSSREESNIEGVVGLEIMRHDLEQMGFGLPWGWSQPNLAAIPPELRVDAAITNDPPINYLEAVDANGLKLNDAPSSVPRALALSQTSNGFGVFGAFTSAYIAVKGASLGSSKASQRWTTIPFHNFSGNPRESRPSANPGSPQTGDRVIMITSHFNDSNLDHRLVVKPDDNAVFYQDYSIDSMSANFLPVNDLYSYMAYGIDSNTNPRMPFNRADFFIKIPTSGEGGLPSFCAPRTGVLYKATIDHVDGAYQNLPLLDCVAAMKVVLGWDTSEDGGAGKVDAYSTPPDAAGNVLTSSTDPNVPNADINATIRSYFTDTTNPELLPVHIRKHLKMVKVYILAQDGKLDRNYTAPVTSIEVGNRLVDGLYTTNYALSPEQQHYRWKLYKIIARPKNLSSNQR